MCQSYVSGGIQEDGKTKTRNIAIDIASWIHQRVTTMLSLRSLRRLSYVVGGSTVQRRNVGEVCVGRDELGGARRTSDQSYRIVARLAPIGTATHTLFVRREQMQSNRSAACARERGQRLKHFR
jgi:hypothetical protein